MCKCKICEKEATRILELNYIVELCEEHYDLIVDITERIIDAFEQQVMGEKSERNNR